MTNATPTGSVCPLRRPPKGKDHPSASRTAFFGLPPDSRNPSSPQPSRLLDSPHHHADVGLSDEKSGLKGNLAYETELRIYNELQCQGDPFGAMSFASFLQNNHSESNWFLSLLRAAQPYLCDRSELRSAESPSSEKRSHLWEVVRVAADDLATRTAEAAIEPVAVAVCSLIPFMAGAPPAVAAGLAIFLVHYAKKGYCGAKVQQEIVQTLAWRDW